MQRAATHGARGFTLVELLVVLGIVAIITAIALPTFSDSARKARRADAVALLTGLQQAQERFRANNPAYATSLTQLPGAQTQGDHYQVSISEATASTYTLLATARTGSTQADDSACKVMSLRMSVGGNVTYAGTADQAAPCWVR